MNESKIQNFTYNSDRNVYVHLKIHIQLD